MEFSLPRFPGAHNNILCTRPASLIHDSEQFADTRDNFQANQTPESNEMHHTRRGDVKRFNNFESDLSRLEGDSFPRTFANNSSYDANQKTTAQLGAAFLINNLDNDQKLDKSTAKSVSRPDNDTVVPNMGGLHSATSCINESSNSEETISMNTHTGFKYRNDSTTSSIRDRMSIASFISTEDNESDHACSERVDEFRTTTETMEIPASSKQDQKPLFSPLAEENIDFFDSRKDAFSGQAWGSDCFTKVNSSNTEDSIGNSPSQNKLTLQYPLLPPRSPDHLEYSLSGASKLLDTLRTPTRREGFSSLLNLSPHEKGNSREIPKEPRLKDQRGRVQKKTSHLRKRVSESVSSFRFVKPEPNLSKDLEGSPVLTGNSQNIDEEILGDVDSAERSLFSESTETRESAEPQEPTVDLQFSDLPESLDSVESVDCFEPIEKPEESEKSELQYPELEYPELEPPELDQPEELELSEQSQLFEISKFSKSKASPEPFVLRTDDTDSDSESEYFSAFSEILEVSDDGNEAIWLEIPPEHQSTSNIDIIDVDSGSDSDIMEVHEEVSKRTRGKVGNKATCNVNHIHIESPVVLESGSDSDSEDLDLSQVPDEISHSFGISGSYPGSVTYDDSLIDKQLFQMILTEDKDDALLDATFNGYSSDSDPEMDHNQIIALYMGGDSKHILPLSTIRAILDRWRPKKDSNECPICGRDFYKRDRLRAHINVHRNHKQLQCPKCPKKLSRPDSLRVHMRLHDPSTLVECVVCHRKLSGQMQLERHMKTHTGEKPFKCKVCGKGLATNAILKQHMRLHTGEKPYECKICGKKVTCTANLQVHIRSHLGMKLFNCELCQRSFSSRAGLGDHLRVHSGEKPFKCEFCGKRFASKSNWSRHARQHT